MLRQIRSMELEGFCMEPDHSGCKALRHFWRCVGRNQHIPAAQINFIFEFQDHRLRSNGLAKVALEAHDRLHTALLPRRQRQYRVTWANGPVRDSSCKSAKARIGTNDVLNRKS